MSEKPLTNTLYTEDNGVYFKVVGYNGYNMYECKFTIFEHGDGIVTTEELPLKDDNGHFKDYLVMEVVYNRNTLCRGICYLRFDP
jgi:hypothetical protein